MINLPDQRNQNKFRIPAIIDFYLKLKVVYKSAEISFWCRHKRTRAPGDDYFFVNTSETEFMQYLSPVGLAPSLNTCPKCAPQRLQVAFIRSML